MNSYQSQTSSNEFDDDVVAVTPNFNTRYVASAWNDRHASPTRKAGHVPFLQSRFVTKSVLGNKNTDTDIELN